MTELNTIAQIADSTRKLTDYYISKLDVDKIHHVYTSGDTKFNTAYWVIAHLVWSEHALLIESLGGPDQGISWLNDFKLGSKCEEKESHPSFQEVLAAKDKVHEASLAWLGQLDDKVLDDEPEVEGFFRNKRLCAYHFIRHESMHTGNLAWLNKMMGSSKMP